MPLAYQIGARYLNGYDLEYDASLVTAIIEQRDRQANPPRPPSVKFTLTVDVDSSDGGGSGEVAPIYPSATLVTAEAENMRAVRVITATKTKDTLSSVTCDEERAKAITLRRVTMSSEAQEISPPIEILGE